MSFRLEPVSLNADGAGSYTIRYGRTSARMQAILSTTPFVWSVGDEHDTLLANSGADFLWHQVTPGPTPTATIRFMQCSFRE